MIARILTLICTMVQISSVVGQFTYFNNVYKVNHPDTSEFILRVIPYTTEYKTFGITITNGQSKLVRHVFGDQGEEILQDVWPLNFNFTPGNAGLLSESVRIMDSESLVMLNIPGTACSQPTLSLTKINIGLDTIWSRRYDEIIPSLCENDYVPWCMDILNNGNILTVGRYRYGQLDLQDSLFQAYYEIDATNGNIVSSHKQEKTTDTFFLGINEIDGLRVLNGDTLLHWGKTNHNPQNSPQRFVKKTDRFGNFIDSLQFGNPVITERGYSALELLGGDSAVFMFMHSTQQLGITSFKLKPRVVFIKISTMEILDEIEYDLPFFDDQVLGSATINSIIQTRDHSIVANFSTTTPLGLNKSGICKLDMVGNVIWWNLYSPTLPEFVHQILYNLSETPDGGYVTVGLTTQSLSSPAKQWLLKIDACGYEEPMDCPEIIVDNMFENEMPTFVAWPNPFHQELKANLPDDAILVEWLDMSGRIIHTEQVFYPKQSFNLSKLADGNYMMRVVMQDGKSSVRRVVKQ